MIAVSPPSDPTGAWSKWAIDADLDNNVQQFNNVADFPGLGVDAFNVYVTANMFNAASAGQYSKVWVIPKAQLLAVTPPATITCVRIPRSPGIRFHHATRPHLRDPRRGVHPLRGIPQPPGCGLDRQPRRHPGLELPAAGPGDLVRFDEFPSGAPQLGTDCTVDTADTRMLHAVYRNGSVWATHHVAGPSGKVEVAWYRINPGTGALVVAGTDGGPESLVLLPLHRGQQGQRRRHRVQRLVGLNELREYIGGYYTIIQPSTGTAEAVALLKAGEAIYAKSFSSGENRWGDFSATMVDPTDDTSFWTLQEYAMTHVTFTDINNNAVDRSRWGTWWGKFAPDNPPAPPLPPEPPPPPPPSGNDGGGGCLTISRSGN